MVMAMTLDEVVLVWVVVVEVVTDLEQVLYMEILKELAVVEKVVQAWGMIVGVFGQGVVFVQFPAVGKQCYSFAYCGLLVLVLEQKEAAEQLQGFL